MGEDKGGKENDKFFVHCYLSILIFCLRTRKGVHACLNLVEHGHPLSFGFGLSWVRLYPPDNTIITGVSMEGGTLDTREYILSKVSPDPAWFDSVVSFVILGAEYQCAKNI